MEIKDQLSSIYSDTSRLKTPHVINDVCTQDISKLRNAVYEMLENFDLEDKGFRLWIEGEKNENLKKTVVDNPIYKRDSLEDWSKELFKDQKFGIILNSGQAYSKKSRDLILSYIKPLIDDRIPFGGIDFSVFIGNYGWTPIGIHQDHKGSFVLHFHLGPGKKTMYMWEHSNYEKNFKKNYNLEQIEGLIPFADYICEFEEGDVFFMPWDFYHIGNSENLSIGLTVWFNYTTTDGVLNGVWDNVSSNLYKSDLNNDTVIPGIKSLNDTSLVEDVLSNINEKMLNQSLENLMESHINDYAFALKSNQWFEGVNQKKLGKSTLNVSLLDEESIILNQTGIVMLSVKSEINLFHKGNKVSLLDHKDLQHLINEINKGKILVPKEVLNGLFKEWPQGIGIRILEILLENNFILKT